MTQPTTYLVAAHPHWRASRVNRRLRDAASGLPGVQVQDLYDRYADYDIDVAHEQARLAAARLVVLLHPVQWYSMPALLKLWIDEVLAHGWAYGAGGTALQGKDLWLVATTGGPESSYRQEGYNRHAFAAFLPPYQQTAALCGMRFLSPLVLHGAHAADEARIAAHVAAFVERLSRYPDWPELAEAPDCPDCAVPGQDRPAVAAGALPGQQTGAMAQPARAA